MPFLCAILYNDFANTPCLGKLCCRKCKFSYWFVAFASISKCRGAVNYAAFFSIQNYIKWKRQFNLYTYIIYRQRAILDAIVFLEISNDTFAASRLTSTVIYMPLQTILEVTFFDTSVIANRTYRRILPITSHVITLRAIHSLYSIADCRTHVHSFVHTWRRVSPCVTH